MATAKNNPVGQVHLQRLEEIETQIEIVGKTPVIPHRWSEKAKALMKEKQTQGSGVRQRREPKNPEQEAQDACYWLEVGGNEVPALPATGFKAAMVGACRFFDGMTMTIAKTLFYIVGDGPDQLVPFQGAPTLREDTPRNASGVADLRYRYSFFPWSTTLTVRFLPSQITHESIVALLDAAGRGGIGDWRPSSPKSATGTFGQWVVPE